ncbi:MAG: phosphotransferase [Candidatus Latescibacteria bacterium]|nr:phosphotransferase [Candidatus Latescibacterota bacterium]
MPHRPGTGLLGEKLAAGRTAEIHAWGEGQVLKLCHPWVWAGDAESERRKTAIAVALGLPVPAVGEIVQLGERTGLVFARVEGESMMARLEREPGYFEAAARQLAQLHLALHERTAPDSLPAQREVLARRLGEAPLLSPAQREAALQALARQPVGDRLCHGDFHPGNLILSPAGPVIIDWIDASRGCPAADLARSVLLFRGHIETSGVPPALRQAMEHFHQTYLDTYLAAAPARRDVYRRWFPLMAAARLCEGIAEQNDWLLQQVREGLTG